MKREDQVLTGVTTPHEHDVLMGRGNGAKDHIGNQKFRKMVQAHLPEYVACHKSNRAQYAQTVIDELRALDPPSRFLERDGKTKLWSDIGDDRTLRKVRQRFREDAPKLEKQKKGGDGAASSKGTKDPDTKLAPVASATPTLVPDNGPSQVVSSNVEGDNYSDGSAEYYEDFDDIDDDIIDALEQSLDHLEPLAIEDDTIGPFSNLHSSCPTTTYASAQGTYGPTENFHSSCPAGRLGANLIRRSGALDLNAEDETRNFMNRQNGTLDLNADMRLVRSDPHTGKRDSLNVGQQNAGGMSMHRQSGVLDLGATPTSPDMAAAVAAAQAEVRGAGGDECGSGSERSQHYVSAVPLNDQNKRHTNERSRSGPRHKFARGAAAYSTSSGDMTISVGDISQASNLASVFEDRRLSDGFDEEKTEAREKQLADGMKKMSEMSLEDDYNNAKAGGVATARTLDGLEKLSGMSLDDTPDVNPTPLRELKNPPSALSMTLSQTMDLLGDSAFGTVGGEEEEAPVINETAQEPRPPPTVTMDNMKVFSDMSLADETKPATDNNPGPTKLPSDFTLTMSPSYMGSSEFSNFSETSIAIIEQETKE